MVDNGIHTTGPGTENTSYCKQKNIPEIFLALKLSDAVSILLINVKMPTIVGILTFMSMITYMLS